jgi:hypothetical protein
MAAVKTTLALVGGTKQTLSNLFFLSIDTYGLSSNLSAVNFAIISFEGKGT